MIVKDLDPLTANDAFARAGRAAEEQMAHYLRRAFAADADIAVFNGLRLEFDHDAAQMDHVVLHPYGLVIIESKSVTAKLHVNAREEWTRYYGRNATGMSSPILQAERQAEFLRSYLKRSPEVLAGKELAINVRVAISDTGVITFAKGVESDQVFKADQIPNEVRDIIGYRRTMQSMPGFMSRMLAMAAGGVVGSALDQETRTRLRKFLLAYHRPLPLRAAPIIQPVPSALSQPASMGHQTRELEQERPSRKMRERPEGLNQDHGSGALPACSRCGSVALSVEYGYSYYFKCMKCKASTAMRLVCPTCSGSLKVRKAGLEFFQDCSTCGTSAHFHTNGAS